MDKLTIVKLDPATDNAALLNRYVTQAGFDAAYANVEAPCKWFVRASDYVREVLESIKPHPTDHIKLGYYLIHNGRFGFVAQELVGSGLSDSTNPICFPIFETYSLDSPEFHAGLLTAMDYSPFDPPKNFLPTRMGWLHVVCSEVPKRHLRKYKLVQDVIVTRFKDDPQGLYDNVHRFWQDNVDYWSAKNPSVELSDSDLTNLQGREQLTIEVQHKDGSRGLGVFTVYPEKGLLYWDFTRKCNADGLGNNILIAAYNTALEMGLRLSLGVDYYDWKHTWNPVFLAQPSFRVIKGLEGG